MTVEEKYDWCEFYHFANRFSNSSNSTDLRCGISRFYYSAFCTCREYIFNHLYWLDEESRAIMTSDTGEVHGETIKFFCDNNNIDSRIGKKIGRELFRVRRLRNKADYNSVNSSFSYDYRYTKARVNIIFERLNEL